MVDPSSIAGIVGSSIQQLMNQLYYLVGGIFGISVILVALRWWEYRTLRLLLKDIKIEIVHLNKNLGYNHIQKKPRFVYRQFQAMIEKLNQKLKRTNSVKVKKRKVNKKREKKR